MQIVGKLSICKFYVNRKRYLIRIILIRLEKLQILPWIGLSFEHGGLIFSGSLSDQTSKFLGEEHSMNRKSLLLDMQRGKFCPSYKYAIEIEHIVMSFSILVNLSVLRQLRLSLSVI